MLNNILVRMLLAMIRVYQLVLSPLVGRSCRFQPTCSAYAHEALAKYGPWRGTWLVLKRLGRCHPVTFLGGRSGYDPAP